MRLENTKNASKTIVSGVMSKVSVMVLQFLLRTAFIYRLGAEYLGLNSLFASILNILNFAELGLSSSIIYCMYKPIAEDRMDEVCALMKFFRRCYAVIGAIVLLIGLILIPFLPLVVKGDIPKDINIYSLYFLILANTVASYYMYSYKICLLTAFQKEYIKNNISIILGIIQYGVQILLIYIIPNYYIYLITNIAFTLVGNVLTAKAVDKNFPYLQPKGKIDKDVKNTIISKVKGLMVFKISSEISSSFDTVVISSFLGLAVLGKLNNYNFISTSVASILSICRSSIVPGIGNRLVIRSKEENVYEYLTLNFIYYCICGWCTVCILCLAQPFMKVWAGSDFLFPLEIVVEIALLFYITQTVSITDVYRSASGIWDQDKLRPMIAAFANLILNIILVKSLGVFGVLLSSIVIQFVFNYGWSTRILFRTVFKISSKQYYIQSFKISIVTMCVGIITYIVTNSVSGDGLLNLIIKAMICVMVSSCLYIIMLSKIDGYQNAKEFLLKLTRSLLETIIKKSRR